MLDISHPGLSGGSEGLGGVCSWCMGWDDVLQAYCWQGESIPVDFSLITVGGCSIRFQSSVNGALLNHLD